LSLFDQNEKNENDYLIKKLENYYNIEVYLDVKSNLDSLYLKKQMMLIKNANLFVCILSKNFLKATNCMSQLQYALKYSRKVFILKNVRQSIENFSQLNEEYGWNNPKCKILNFVQEENDQDRLLDIVYDYLK
jgi:hypothetical protein